MSEELQLIGEKRSGQAGVVRRSGNIPAVLYGHGIEPQHVAIESRVFQKLFAKAGYTTMVTLSLEDGKTHPVFVREVQFHPIKNTIIHIDFYQVRMDEAIKADVPIKFVGDSPAVKDLAGMLVRNLDELEVEALPMDMPHDIEVDISSLVDFDSVIHIKDIVLPKGVTTDRDGDDVVALVQPPRSEAELEALSEEVKEDVESVEGVKKEEPGEGEGAAEGEKAGEADAKKEE